MQGCGIFFGRIFVGGVNARTAFGMQGCGIFFGRIFVGGVNARTAFGMQGCGIFFGRIFVGGVNARTACSMLRILKTKQWTKGLDVPLVLCVACVPLLFRNYRRGGKGDTSPSNIKH